ncbi:MAG: DUF1207 domain-containing protein [Candidatus Kapabacteria bacterium]|nr:DUF1207 domain-containing protein [Candidatus Kapabacteria bacterium]
MFTVHALAVDDRPFPAPIANPLEARIGLIVQPAVKRLRLDIGASVDIDELFRDSTRGWMRLGADFMTYTRLRSDGNFKFPVETSDYYFGVNATWQAPQSPLQIRLRIAHISSHLVDGSADANGTFVERKPFVYSREFAELLVGWTFGALRPYAGVTYVWARQPHTPDPFIPQAGIDIRLPLSKSFQLRGGYDWKLIGISGTYVTAQAAQLGVFAELWDGRGLMLSAYGYNGRSMHGMYFDTADSYLGVGFQIVW